MNWSNKRILIIGNPLVGIQKEKRHIIERVSSYIVGRGGTVDVTYTMKPGIGGKYASRATLEGYDAVYAAGGDGTINDVASGLLGRATPLGIIPLGTGNGLARGLALPFEVERLIDVLERNNIIAIDVGKISSRIFLATAGIGYDASIAHDFNTHRKPVSNIYQYFYFGVKQYLFSGPERITLIVNGQEMERKIFALTICNTPQYGGGAIIAPDANPTSGKLVAVLIPKFTMVKALWAIKKLFNSTANEIKELEFITFTSLTIKRKKPGLFHADGEAVKGDATLTVSVLPSLLHVIVP
jgi:diacylglycerol kinase (ATP)